MYYASDEPDRATASEPQPGKDMFATTLGVGILGVGVVILVGVMVQYG